MKLFLRITAIALFIFAGKISAQNFTVIDTLPEGAYGNADWGDFDGDGLKDLVYITQAIPNAILKVYRNTGKAFTEIKQHFPGMYNTGVKWGDLNQDGFEDLVVNGMDSLLVNRTFIYKSLGNGKFIFMPNSIFPLSAGCVDIADYNNDGFKDIAVTGMDSTGGHHAYIYKNSGGFQFTKLRAQLSGIHFGELKWGDYNKDQLPDLVINGIGNNEFRVRIYKNMGGDSFQMQPFYMKGSGGTVDWADLDKDGWPDLLVTGYDSTSGNSFTEVHRNNTNGTFSLVKTNLPEFGEPSAVAIADFNLDGQQDICFAGGSADFPSTGSALSIRDSINKYNSKAFFRSDITNCIIKTTDMDNDGDDDLLLSNLIIRNDSKTSSGIRNFQTDPSLVNLYPNPARDYLFIKSTKQVTSISIYDVSGKEIRTYSEIQSPEIPLFDLDAAVYTVRIKTSDGLECFKRVIVTE